MSNLTAIEFLRAEAEKHRKWAPRRTTIAREEDKAKTDPRYRGRALRHRRMMYFHLKKAADLESAAAVLDPMHLHGFSVSWVDSANIAGSFDTWDEAAAAAHGLEEANPGDGPWLVLPA